MDLVEGAFSEEHHELGVGEFAGAAVEVGFGRPPTGWANRSSNSSSSAKSSLGMKTRLLSLTGRNQPRMLGPNGAEISKS